MDCYGLGRFWNIDGVCFSIWLNKEWIKLFRMD